MRGDLLGAVLGATTLDECPKGVEKDAALERRFHPGAGSPDEAAPGADDVVAVGTEASKVMSQAKESGDEDAAVGRDDVAEVASDWSVATNL